MMNPDLFSLFSYGSAFCVTFFFANKYEKLKKRKYLLFSFITTLFFCGFRFYVGNDYDGYYSVFQAIRTFPKDIWFIEPGYVVLNRLFSFSPIGYFYVLFTCSTITFGIVFNLLAKNNILKWGTFSIYTLGFLIIANDQVRQMIAIPIFFFAINYIGENKPVKYFILIVIAITFHYSALICFVAFGVRYISINKKWAMIFLCLALIIKISGSVEIVIEILSQNLSLLNEKYAYKVLDERYFAEETIGIQLLYFWIISLFSLLSLPSDSFKGAYVKIFVIGTCLYTLFWGQMLFERISLYFFELIIFVFPMAIQQNKIYCKILIVICLAYFSLQSLFALEKNGAVPYRTIFQENLVNPKYDRDVQQDN